MLDSSLCMCSHQNIFHGNLVISFDFSTPNIFVNERNIDNMFSRKPLTPYHENIGCEHVFSYTFKPLTTNTILIIQI